MVSKMKTEQFSNEITGCGGLNQQETALTKKKVPFSLGVSEKNRNLNPLITFLIFYYSHFLCFFPRNVMDNSSLPSSLLFPSLNLCFISQDAILYEDTPDWIFRIPALPLLYWELNHYVA